MLAPFDAFSSSGARCSGGRISASPMTSSSWAGHSMLLMNLLSGVAEEFGARIGLREFFGVPTPGCSAVLVRAAAGMLGPGLSPRTTTCRGWWRPGWTLASSRPRPWSSSRLGSLAPSLPPDLPNGAYSPADRWAVPSRW